MRASLFVVVPFLVATTVLVAGCDQTPSPPGEAEPTDLGSVYQSPAGYQVAIPEEWAGSYDVQEEPKVDVDARGATSVTDFVYTPTDTSLMPAALMTVLTYTAEQWSQIAQQGGPPPGEPVAECGDATVVVSMPQSNPYGSDTSDGATFDELYQAIDPELAVTCAPAP
jgi:hypothetical protein